MIIYIVTLSNVFQGWNGQGCQTLEVSTAKITPLFGSVPPFSVEQFTDPVSFTCIMGYHNILLIYFAYC